MANKLAITISGAVSLGSYEAGVAFEVLDAVSQHNEWADELARLFLNRTLTPAMTSPVSEILLRAFFAERNEMTQAATANLNAARAQLQQQYATEYAQFGERQVADAWLDTVLVLERAARLHEKEEMLIYGFVAEPELLSSTGLMAFAGFFDVSYRKHDYDYGRSVAQQRLGE